MAVLTQHIPPATAQKTDSCLFQPPGTLPPLFRVRIGHILGSAAPRGRRPQPPAAQRRKEDMSIPAPRSPGTLFCSPRRPPSAPALPPLPALRPRLSVPGSPSPAPRPWLSVPVSPFLALRPWLSVPGSPSPALRHMPQPTSQNPDRGIFLAPERKRGIQGGQSKFSRPGGRVEAVGLRAHAPLRRAHAPRHAPPHRRRQRSRSGPLFAPIQQLLACRLLVVVMLAQALQVRWSHEQRPVAAMRHDVVHHRGTGTAARVARGIHPRAHAAERLPHQLLRPEPSRPYRQRVPGVVVFTDTALVPWLMLRAPAVPRQLRTAGMSARPQRSVRHGLSPPRSPGKTKEPEPTTTHILRCHWPRLSKHWPSSISTINSRLHSRQYTTRRDANASCGTCINLRFRHPVLGHCR